MTAAVIVSLLVVIGFVTSALCVAVWILRDVTARSNLSLDRAHQRWVKQTSDLLDRLMAKNWAEYAEIKAFDEPGVEGFFTPEEQNEEPPDVEDWPARDGDEEITQIIPRAGVNWGSLSGPEEIPRPDADTERLLAEDFTLEGDPRRAGE
jgi:hypothetical protein